MTEKNCINCAFSEWKTVDDFDGSKLLFCFESGEEKVVEEKSNCPFFAVGAAKIAGV